MFLQATFVLVLACGEKLWMAIFTKGSWQDLEKCSISSLTTGTQLRTTDQTLSVLCLIKHRRSATWKLVRALFLKLFREVWWFLHENDYNRLLIFSYDRQYSALLWWATILVLYVPGKRGAGGGRAGVGVYNVTTPPTSWIGYSWGSYEKIGDCKQSSKNSPLWLAIWSADRNRVFF